MSGLLQTMIANAENISNLALVETIHGHCIYIKPLVNGHFVEDSTVEVILPARLRKENNEVLVGDLLVYEPSESKVISVLPRKNSLLKPHCANIDTAIVVVATSNPAPDWEHLDRVLALASIELPERPIICLSKADLGEAPKHIDIYRDLGYAVFDVCSNTGHGIEILRKRLAGKLSILAGRSGVGKSSLLKALCPQARIDVGELSSKVDRGRHTTRHIQLYPISSSKPFTMLIDAPGFQRTEVCVSPERIINSSAFPEVHMQRQRCSFAGCTHRGEQGCAVDFIDTRRRSYNMLLEAAESWIDKSKKSRKLKKQANSTKQDSNVKMPMLKAEQRAISRRKFKQANWHNEFEQLDPLQGSP